MSDEATKWRFRGAVYGALQGHAKPLADLLERLRDGHPRTAEDEALLGDYIERLRTKPKGTSGRKPAPRLFGHTWTIRHLAAEARRLQELAPELKLTNKRAADVVAGPEVLRRNRRLVREAVARFETPPADPSAETLAGQMEALACQVVREMER